MSDPSIPESQRRSQTVSESEESFGDLLSQHEKSRSRKTEDANKGREGTVVAITADSVLVDIGYKSEGILPLAVFQSAGETIKPGDKLRVTVKGRDPDGYYELSRGKVERPTDGPALEKAFAEKAAILGTVTAVGKGALTLDFAWRPSMPAAPTATPNA